MHCSLNSSSPFSYLQIKRPTSARPNDTRTFLCLTKRISAGYRIPPHLKRDLPVRDCCKGPFEAFAIRGVAKCWHVASYTTVSGWPVGVSVAPHSHVGHEIGTYIFHAKCLGVIWPGSITPLTSNRLIFASRHRNMYFPGRPGAFVHEGCFVGDGLKALYGLLLHESWGWPDTIDGRSRYR